MSISRPKVGVAALVVQDGKVLLGKRKGSHGSGQWAPPGGHLECGESVEGCAARELLEETGLQALSSRLGPWTNDIFGEDKHYITLWVFIDQFTGEVQLLEPHKCEEWKWVAWDELPAELFLPLKNFMKNSPISSNPLSRFAAYLSP